MVLWRYQIVHYSNTSHQLKLFLLMSPLSILPLNFSNAILKFPALLQVSSNLYQTHLKLTCFPLLELQNLGRNWWQQMPNHPLSTVSLLQICSHRCYRPHPPHKPHLNIFSQGPWSKSASLGKDIHALFFGRREGNKICLIYPPKIKLHSNMNLHFIKQLKFYVCETQRQHDKLTLRTVTFLKSGTSEQDTILKKSWQDSH